MFNVISDVHTEFCEEGSIPFTLEATAPYLILAGDIGNLEYGKDSFISFCSEVSKRYRRVFYVLGNHEYYSNLGIDYQQMLEDIHLEISSRFDNIEILNNRVVTVDGVDIAGTTLWSRVSKKKTNDFNKIYTSYTNNITVDVYNQWHEESVEWLTSVINEEHNERQLIVVTHYAPLLSSSSDSHFETDLSHLFKKGRLKAWVYGHTHSNKDFYFNGVRVLSNQSGYCEDERHGFDSSKKLVI